MLSFFNRIYLSGLLLALLAYEYYVLKGLFSCTSLFRINEMHEEIHNMKSIDKTKWIWQKSRETNENVGIRRRVVHSIESDLSEESCEINCKTHKSDRGIVDEALIPICTELHDDVMDFYCSLRWLS